MRLAAAQFNRISRAQLVELGFGESAIKRRLAAGRLVIVETGVFAFAPVLPHDQWGRWMGATLTAPNTVLSHWSAAAAWDLLRPRPGPVSVTRPGLGGPRRHGGVFVHRSETIVGASDVLNGIPITTVPRTLLDLAGQVTDASLARAFREAIRLRRTSLAAVGDQLGEARGRRGVGRLAAVMARYAGLPLERARSGVEVRALEILREAGVLLPRLNVVVAGFEADLVWPAEMLIVEIDGGPFHLDLGADARKQQAWEAAGWTVRRISADAVYEHPERLLALSPPPTVPFGVV